MKRRIVSIILALALILTVCGVGCIGVSAEDNVATITVGNKTYTAKVGDFIEYSISFRLGVQRLQRERDRHPSRADRTHDCREFRCKTI